MKVPASKNSLSNVISSLLVKQDTPVKLEILCSNVAKYIIPVERESFHEFFSL